MAKRLIRARQKIAAARIPYRVPAEAELADRLPAVCGGDPRPLHRGHAPATATRRSTSTCAPGGPAGRAPAPAAARPADPAAVLALLLLTEARRPARVDEEGDA